jgi:predicted metal-dependent phosphoesterase TrpH
MPDTDTERHRLLADLHSHSVYSDGTLTPRQLVERARNLGVELFALTDHDEVSGIAEARAAAAQVGLAFVPGVEISVTWGGKTIHVVGLGVDDSDAALRAGLERLRSGRTQRAQQMADGLAAAGIARAFDGAMAHVSNPAMISRTHFARFLVDQGICRDVKEVFKRFLIEGKPGYVPHRWATLTDAVTLIIGAGGVAVLAHPGRYRLHELALDQLLREFRLAGGIAIEVVTSNHSPDQTRRFGQLALEHGFEGSRGSDFHGPGEAENVELGRVAPLPAALVPVWHRYA